MSSFRLTRQTFLRTAAGIGSSLLWKGGGTALAADPPARVGDPLPPEIEKAWTARQGRWDRMYCEVSGYTVVAKEALNGIPGSDPVPVDQVRNVQLAIWIDLKLPRLRIESRPDNHDHSWKVMLHDGKRLQIRDGQGKPVDPNGIDRSLFEFRYWPILFGHGMVGGPEGWLTPTKLRRAYDRKNYDVAAVKDSIVTLRSKPFFNDLYVMEYDVDPARESLVVGARFLTGRGEPRIPSNELLITEVRENMPVKWTFRCSGLNDFLQIDRRDLDPDFTGVQFRFPGP